MRSATVAGLLLTDRIPGGRPFLDPSENPVTNLKIKGIIEGAGVAASWSETENILWKTAIEDRDHLPARTATPVRDRACGR